MEGGRPRRRLFDLEFRSTARNIPTGIVEPEQSAADSTSSNSPQEPSTGSDTSSSPPRPAHVPHILQPLSQHIQPPQAYFIDSFFGTTTVRLNDHHPGWVEVRVDGHVDMFLPAYGFMSFQINLTRRVFMPIIVTPAQQSS